MMDGIVPNLVRQVIVSPQNTGHHGITVHDFEANTATFLETVGHGLQRQFERVSRSRDNRFGICVGMVGLHLGAFVRIERPVRSPEPALGDPEIVGIESLVPILR